MFFRWVLLLLSQNASEFSSKTNMLPLKPMLGIPSLEDDASVQGYFLKYASSTTLLAVAGIDNKSLCLWVSSQYAWNIFADQGHLSDSTSRTFNRSSNPLLPDPYGAC